MRPQNPLCAPPLPMDSAYKKRNRASSDLCGISSLRAPCARGCGLTACRIAGAFFIFRKSRFAGGESFPLAIDKAAGEDYNNILYKSAGCIFCGTAFKE